MPSVWGARPLPRKLGPMRFGGSGGGPLPRDSLAFGDGLGWRWVGGRLGAVFFVFSGGCLGVVDFGRDLERIWKGSEI